MLRLAAGRRARAVEEEAPFEEFDREPRIFDEIAPSAISPALIVAVLAVVLFLAVVLQPSGFLTSALSSALHLSLGIGAYVLPVHFGYRGREPALLRVDRRRFASTLGRGACHDVFPCVHVGPFAAYAWCLNQWRCAFRRECACLARWLRWLWHCMGASAAVRRSREHRAPSRGRACRSRHHRLFAYGRIRVASREKGSQFNARLRAVCDAEDDELPGIPYEAADENDNPYAALDENRPQAQVVSPEARVPRREERGLLAGFGMTKKEREAAAAARAAQEAQREVPAQHAFVVPKPVHVPRDLSRPRRASESLSTQLLEGRRPGQAPVPTVDTYWPAEYAFGAADDVVSAASNAAAGAAGVATGMGVAHAAEGARDAPA